jgi:CMP-N-acetylneuraminic acid synthetase
MKLATIPVCESKRIPRKNIKEFIVKSIIAWVNLAAQKNGLWLIK